MKRKLITLLGILILTNLNLSCVTSEKEEKQDEIDLEFYKSGEPVSSDLWCMSAEELKIIMKEAYR